MREHPFVHTSYLRKSPTSIPAIDIYVPQVCDVCGRCDITVYPRGRRPPIWSGIVNIQQTITVFDTHREFVFIFLYSREFLGILVLISVCQRPVRLLFEIAVIFPLKSVIAEYYHLNWPFPLRVWHLYFHVYLCRFLSLVTYSWSGKQSCIRKYNIEMVRSAGRCEAEINAVRPDINIRTDGCARILRVASTAWVQKVCSAQIHNNT